MSEKLSLDFEKKAGAIKEQEIYSACVNLVSACSDEERLAAFVYLYKLAEADSSISNKEVRFLPYGPKINNVSFEDVILFTNMTGK